MFEELISRLAQALDALKVPYMVIGGQALLLYAEPRMTRDIDITLGSGLERLPEILQASIEAGLEALPDDVQEFAQKTLVLPLVDTDTHIRVDFIFSLTDYERSAIERSRIVKLHGTNVHFAAPEDLIVHKIFAGRPIDLEDVKKVLVKHKNLDTGYIRLWLKEFDLTLPEKKLLETFEALLPE